MNWLQAMSLYSSSVWQRCLMRSHPISLGQCCLHASPHMYLALFLCAIYDSGVMRFNAHLLRALLLQFSHWWSSVIQFGDIPVSAGGVQPAARHVLDAAVHATHNSLPWSGEALA